MCVCAHNCVVLLCCYANPNLSEEGLFNARLKFPEDFPSHPPEMTFTNEMWHPNSASLTEQRLLLARAWCA